MWKPNAVGVPVPGGKWDVESGRESSRQKVAAGKPDAVVCPFLMEVGLAES